VPLIEMKIKMLRTPDLRMNLDEAQKVRLAQLNALDKFGEKVCKHAQVV